MPPPTAPETNLPPSTSSGILPSDASAHKWTVDSAIANIPVESRPPTIPQTTPTAYFHFLQRLKTTKREGWRRFGIKHGESIADHMYRMAMITMIAPPELAAGLDLNKCTRMALIHDVAESLVGDITPVDGVTKDEKNRRESSTMDYICSALLGNVDGGAQAAEIRRIWQEYEDSETRESIFVHDVDKIELILQMVEYEKTYADGIDVSGTAQGKRGGEAEDTVPFDLGEFTWVAGKIKSDAVKDWARALLKERSDFWTSRGVTNVKGFTMEV